MPTNAPTSLCQKKLSLKMLCLDLKSSFNRTVIWQHLLNHEIKVTVTDKLFETEANIAVTHYPRYDGNP